MTTKYMVGDHRKILLEIQRKQYNKSVRVLDGGRWYHIQYPQDIVILQPADLTHVEQRLAQLSSTIPSTASEIVIGSPRECLTRAIRRKKRGPRDIHVFEPVNESWFLVQPQSCAISPVACDIPDASRVCIERRLSRDTNNAALFHKKVHILPEFNNDQVGYFLSIKGIEIAVIVLEVTSSTCVTIIYKHMVAEFQDTSYYDSLLMDTMCEDLVRGVANESVCVYAHSCFRELRDDKELLFYTLHGFHTPQRSTTNTFWVQQTLLANDSRAAMLLPLGKNLSQVYKDAYVSYGIHHTQDIERVRHDIELALLYSPSTTDKMCDIMDYMYYVQTRSPAGPSPTTFTHNTDQVVMQRKTHATPEDYYISALVAHGFHAFPQSTQDSLLTRCMTDATLATNIAANMFHHSRAYSTGLYTRVITCNHAAIVRGMCHMLVGAAMRDEKDVWEQVLRDLPSFNTGAMSSYVQSAMTQLICYSALLRLPVQAWWDTRFTPHYRYLYDQQLDEVIPSLRVFLTKQFST
jgi:hypothetical protein